MNIFQHFSSIFPIHSFVEEKVPQQRHRRGEPRVCSIEVMHSLLKLRLTWCGGSFLGSTKIDGNTMGIALSHPFIDGISPLYNFINQPEKKSNGCSNGTFKKLVTSGKFLGRYCTVLYIISHVFVYLARILS